MKRLLQLGLLLGFIFAIWATTTYPRVGEATFSIAANLESRVYGFEKTTTDIGELNMVAYQGGPVDGPAIVMIHGYTSDKDVWPRFAKHFVDDYRVVIPDLAGHGESGFDSSWSYTIAAQAARVVALLDKLNIDKAHIIGNSMGGYTAAYFAIHYPERTLSAAMLDPAGVKSPQPSDMEKMLEQGKNPFLAGSREDFHRFYPMTMSQPPWLPGFVVDGMATKYLERRDAHAQIFADFHKGPLLTPRLAELRAPALLIWGSEDKLIHVSATAVWTAGIPQLQVEVMEGIGHMPMVEATAETAKIYHGFLSSPAQVSAAK
ncbi:MAG: alpha/beta fold hydrolase [Spongiibacteraceae bacterium]